MPWLSSSESPDVPVKSSAVACPPPGAHFKEPLILATEAPWPLDPLEQGGTRIEAHVTSHSCVVIFALDMGGLKGEEKMPFLAARADLAIIGRPEHVRVALAMGPMAYDAPFAPGLSGPEWHRDMEDGLRGDARFFAIVCLEDGIVRAIKPAVMNAQAWSVLADAVAACPAIHDAAAYDRACASDEARWRPSDLLKVARRAPTHLSQHIVLTTT